MKPSSIARRGYTKDSIPPARRFLVLAAPCGRAAQACLRKAESWNNPPGHGKPDAIGCDRAAKIYPGRMPSRGGTGVHAKSVVQAGKNFKGG